MSTYGLDDVIVGGKAQMVYSDKQFILIKLPLDLEIPNFTEDEEGGNQTKTKEQ